MATVLDCRPASCIQANRIELRRRLENSLDRRLRRPNAKAV
jgi:hypothetical protein